MTMGLSDTTRVVVDRHNFGGFAPAVDLIAKFEHFLGKQIQKAVLEQRTDPRETVASLQLHNFLAEYFLKNDNRAGADSSVLCFSAP